MVTSLRGLYIHLFCGIYGNVSYMNNEISAKSAKSMESDPIDCGVAKVGAGFSASAFFGGGIKLNGELDFNKFSPYKLFDY